MTTLKETKEKINNVRNLSKKGQEQQTTILVKKVAECKAENLEETITKLRECDLKIWSMTKENANGAKTFLETWLYYNYILEDKKTFAIRIKTLKNISAFLNILPYILGVETFDISYKKNNKDYASPEIIISLSIKKPYGNYKTTLEGYGLTLPEETEEEKEKITAEEMEIIQESNSLLESFGLKSAVYNIN